MVFSNFDTADTMATTYQQIAYIDKNPEGYLCHAKYDKFCLATDTGEIARIGENEATFYTILDTDNDTIVDFKITVITGGSQGIYLLAEYSNPNLTYVVGFLDLDSANS